MTNDVVATLNPFGSPSTTSAATPTTQTTDSARAVAEVQAALVIARMNPRDQRQSMDRILNACCRPQLAETAIYAYARGGTNIQGPSIRLAEAIAQQWGNMQFGIRELSNQGGKSEVQAFAWDVETNTRREVTFSVPHIRHTKKGSYKLEDPRDVYELVANQGARRLRACILSVIPGDVIEAAVSQCMLTLEANSDVTPEGIQKLVAAFEAIGVSKARVEKFCQCRAEAIKPAQIIRLRSVYASIKDGMSSPDDWFEPEEKPAEAKASFEKKTLKDKLKERKAKSDTATQPIEEPPAASATVAHEPSTQSAPSPIHKTAEPPLDESWLRAYNTGTTGEPNV